MVRCRSKNEHQKNICLEEIGLRAQNMLTILGLIFNMEEDHGGGDLYDHLMRKGNYHFDDE